MKLGRVRRDIPTGPTHCRTVEGYSDQALNGAIAELGRSVASGRAGQWEKDRLAALEAERERRNRHRRGKDGA